MSPSVPRIGIKAIGINFAAPHFGYPKPLRLRRRSEYQAVYQRGRRFISTHFVLFALRRAPRPDAVRQDEAAWRGQQQSGASAAAKLCTAAGDPALREEPSQVKAAAPPDSAVSRFGITASGKLGGAVVRNRVRRRTRELLRRHAGELGPGWDVVVNPRLSMLAAPFAELDSEIAGLLLRVRQSLG